MREKTEKREKTLPSGVTIEETANLIIEARHCIPPEVPLEIERSIVVCLCKFFGRHYSYDPHVLLYLVRHPLAPVPEDLEELQQSDILDEWSGFGHCREP